MPDGHIVAKEPPLIRRQPTILKHKSDTPQADEGHQVPEEGDEEPLAGHDG